MKRILSKLKISPWLDISRTIFHGYTLSFILNFVNKNCRNFLFLTAMMLSAINAKADLTKDVEPTSIVTCQPNSSTPFTTSFTVGKGSGCSNLSSTGNVTFIWEYFDGSGWVALTNNTPSGFTYSNASVRTGSGAGAVITNTLTVILSSSASIGVFSYRCRANQPTGCTNFVTSNTITVTVYAKPVPTFTAEPGASACANSSVTYTTQAGQSGYTWLIPGVSGTDYTITAGSTTTNTVTLKWLTTGGKTVTINYTNSNGCTAASPTSSTTTTVNGVPSPSFTSQPSGTICSSTAVTYTTQAGQSNYIWSVPGISGTDYTITAGGIGASSNTVTLQWLTSGSKVITINYNNAAGCSAATAVSSNSITITLRPVPTFTTSPAANICSGTDVTYTTQSGQTNYVWTVPGVLNTDYTITSGGIGSGSNTVTLKWLTSGSKSVTVNYTTASCTGLSAASSTTAVTVRPVATFTSSPGANTCANTDVTYTTQAGQSNYVWTVNGTAGLDYNITGGSVGSGSNTVTIQWLTTGSSRTVTVNYNNAGGCNALTAASSATFINARPDVNNFSINAADGCEGTGSIVTVNSSTIANGSYTVTYDLSGSNTATGNIATMVFSGGVGTFTTGAINPGLTNITITQVAAIGCGASPSSGNTASFTINPLPSVSSITGASIVCIGNTITLSNATSGGSWASADVSVATVNASGLVTGVSAGTVDIIYTTAPVNGCTNSAIKNITVNALPTSTPITGTTTLCINTTTNLNNATVGGSWKSSNSPVATINSSGVVSASTAGTTLITYIFPANANGCTDSVFTTVTVDPAATANAGSSTTVCQSASPSAITLSSSSVGGAATTGAWSIVSGGGTLSNLSQTANPAAVTYTPVANFDGTVTLLLTTNPPGSCPAVTATRIITVSQIPTLSTGSAVAVCQSSSPSAITLSGATLGGGATTGAWSITAGSGTLSDISQTANPEIVTFTPTANFSGTVTLTLTTNVSGACAAASATKTINVTTVPTVIGGGPNTVCKGSSAITLSGAGFGGGASSAAWSISAGGGTLSSTLQTASPATVTYTPAAAFTGTVTLVLTSNAPGGCSSANTTRTINVSNPALASASGPNTVCQSASPSTITLSGASVSGGATTGAWSIISGGGTLSSTLQTASPATVTYIPAANFTGTITLRLTTDIPAGCTAATSDRTINVTALPTANAGSAILTCSDVTQTASGSAAVNITAGSSAANQTSILWSSSGTGTFANPNSLTTATYTPSAADKAAGSITLTLTAFGNSPCGNATSSKTFTITPAINENDANNWTQAPNCNGLGVQFSLPAAPGGGNGTFTYQWMQKNNCGTAGASTPVPGATGMSFIPLADNCYWLQISSGGCTLPQNLVSTTTRQRPSPDTGSLANINFGVSGTNPKICIGSSTILTAQSSVSYTYTWSPPTGLSSTTGASVTANPTTTTTYTVTAVATDGTGCTRTAKDTITVSPLTVGGSLPASAVACNSGSASINITGNTGSVTRWESSTDGGATWAPIANTTTTLNYTIAAATTLYRALVQSGACASAFTNATQTGLHNVWQGKTSTDWQTATNWSDQALPTLSCPIVTIPAATPFSPILNYGIATINSLVINSSALLTIANNANMQLAGTITNNGTFDVTDGSLEFNGASPQNISGNAFVSNTVRNIILSNTNGLVVNNSAGNLLNVKEAFTFGNVNNTALTTNDNLVLLSSATGTARIADITNNNANSGNSISGKVTVQRYIPGRRAWRLLTAPVTIPSLVKISDSWQEAAPRVTNPAVINATNNPNPGYGTHVTYGNPATNGFDQGINGNPSILYLTATGWNGIPTATNNGATLNSGYITDQPGYMLFVRGDRGTQLSQATYAATTPTVLRMKGNINTDQLNISLTPGMVFGGSHFRVVGNPYPSAVNFHKIFLNAANSAAGFSDAYYFWDPSVTGTNGVGGWVAMSYNNISGVYDRTVLTGGSSTINNSGDIQSGSAFVIDYNGAATSMRMEEPNKISGSNNSQFRPMYHTNQVRVSLFAKNADSSISVNDAVLVTYHHSYNSAVDKSDMKKLLNFAENIAVVKDSIPLILERRKTFEKVDTINLQLLKMRQKDYQLQVTLDDLSAPEGTVAVLEDKVLNAQTIIDTKSTSEYDFTVNANNIAVAGDRFRLLFRPAAVFMSANSYQQNKDAVIEWSLSEEFNISHYEVERSADGISFSKLADVTGKGNSDKIVYYNWKDIAPATGNYFYRIKAVSNNGIVIYSNKVNIKMLNSKQGMYVFPNPVTGNIIYLQFYNIKKGSYITQLFTTHGQLITSSTLNYTGGLNTLPINAPHDLLNGNYLLKVTGPDEKVISLEVLVQKN